MGIECRCRKCANDFNLSDEDDKVCPLCGYPKLIIGGENLSGYSPLTLRKFKSIQRRYQKIRKQLEKEIEIARSGSDDNNFHLINRQVNQLGGKKVRFTVGFGILLGAVTDEVDYYYLYYDPLRKRIDYRSCLSSVTADPGLDFEITPAEKADIDIDLDWFENNEIWTVIPITPLYKSNTWISECLE